MDTNNFFHWIGEKLGAAIRLIVDGLSWLFGHLYSAMDSFIHGLTSALGTSTSVLSVALLIIGLALLYAGLGAFMRRAVISGVLWTVLALVLLSWLIH